MTRDDLGDVRVIGVSRQSGVHRDIPYLVVRPVDHTRVDEHPLPPLNLSRIDGDTQFLLDLRGRDEPVEELSIEIARSERNYDRTVRVYGADRRDADEWALLADDGYLLDRTRGDSRLEVDVVTFPPTVFDYVRVVIEDDGRPPLEIETVSVIHREEFRVPRREYPGEILSRREDHEENRTIVLFDTGYDDLPTAGIDVDVTFPGDYHRTAWLEVSDSLDEDERHWRRAAAFALYHIEREGKDPIFQDRIDYSEVRGRYLRLTIENGDNEPLRIDDLTALGIDRWLVCERREFSHEDVDFALYGGDPLMTSPDYDLARTAGDYDLFSLATVETGEREINPHFTGPTQPVVPWSEEHQTLLWTLTLAGVLLFGAMTVLLLYKSHRGESPG